jgi:hypothetical protein
VGWRRSRLVRGGITGAAAFFALVLGAPGSAGAATIGPDPFPASPDVTRLCLANQACTFAATAAPTVATYPSVSPVDGVVVRWRALFVGSGTSSTRFRVFSTGINPGDFIARGGSAVETASPGEQSFGTRIQILTGDLIGLNLAGPSSPTLGVGSSDNLGATVSRAEPQPGDASGFTFDATFADSELLVNADVEPDADDDGYGDVTQDLCTSDAGPEACDATLTIGAPDLTVPSSTAGECTGPQTCAMWTSTTPFGQTRQRWASPVDGVIVRWRVRVLNLPQGPLHPVLGPYRLRTIRMASATTFPVVGAAAFESVPHTLVMSDTVHTFATRIPVLVGDRLALDMPPMKTAPLPGGLRFDPRGGSHRITTPAPPDGGTFVTGGSVGGSPQYNADVEPDADRDGFGDVTQDSCPTDATTQGSCPVAPAGGDTGTGTGSPPDATPVPDLVGPVVGIARRTVRLTRRGYLARRLTCPSAEPAGCREGVLRLASAARVNVAVRRIVRLGSKRFSIAAGRSTVVRIRFSRRNRALVRRLGRLRVRARASAIDQAGNRRTTVATFVVLPPRR